MKNVLLIANQYPPMGGSGVQRTGKFVKFLQNFGYRPVVLTRQTGSELLDYSLLNDLPEHKLYRTKAYDLTTWPGLLRYIGKGISKYCLIPDADYLWSRRAYQQAVEIIKSESIEVIYSTSFPYSDHLLGLRLKKRFPELPWVVDFRDEWTQNPYILDRKDGPYRRRKEKQMEAQVVQNCDWFITNTPYMLQNFIRLYPQLAKKSSVIANGFDDADFNQIDSSRHLEPTFTLTYAGAMYGRRKPNHIFKAIHALLQEHKIDRTKFRLRLIGTFDSNKMKQLISQYQLEGIVHYEDYLPHREALEALLAADALLLLIGAGPGAQNFSSGKIFEYINCQRPILAVVPEQGAAADIIRETNSGIICETSSVTAIKRGIQTLYKNWQNQEPLPTVNQAAVNRYHRKNLTKELAAVFDRLTS